MFSEWGSHCSGTAQSLPIQTGVEMLVAWDQAGIIQAIKDVGWRISSCKVDGFLHFAIEFLSNVSTPVGLIALTDILFLTHLRSLEVAARIASLHLPDTVLTKVKSLSGLNVWICLPTTTAFGSIHRAWSRAGTNAEPAVRLVVGAKQVMPHVHVVLPLQERGIQHCSVEGEDQLLDTWVISTPREPGAVLALTRLHRIPRSQFFSPDNLPPGISRDRLENTRTTQLQFLDASILPFQVVDDWRTGPVGGATPYLWTGSTTFLLLPPPLNRVIAPFTE